MPRHSRRLNPVLIKSTETGRPTAAKSGDCMQGRADEAGDAELAERTRRGDQSAYAELWQRHAHAGLTAARQFDSIADADDIVSEAYLRILRALQRGGGPHEAFRPYLYRTIRNVALDWNLKAAPSAGELTEEIESTELDPESTVLENTVTVHAFRTLPERWQAILWYTEVEGMEPAETAPLLGLTPNAAAALSYRAREGLKKAWLQAHVNDRRVPAECRWTTERMGDYVRDALSATGRRRFEAHLRTCARCSILVEEVDDLGGRLASLLLPLTIGGTAGAGLLAALHTDPPPSTASSVAGGARTALPRPVLAVALGAVAAVVIVGAAVAVPGLVASGPEITDAGDEQTQPSRQPTGIPEPTPTPSATPETPHEPDTRTREPDVPAPEAQVPGPPSPPRDTIAPTAPTVLTPADALLSNDPMPRFTGRGEPGARVDVAFPGSATVSATVDRDGAWSLQPNAPIPDGAHTLAFTQVDGAGNRSAAGLRTLTIDTIALAPVIDPLPTEALYLPTVSGTAEPGAVVDVQIDGATVASAVTAADGSWSSPLPDPARDGVTLTASQVDPAGNTSPMSTPSGPLSFSRPTFVIPHDGAVIESTGGATVVTLELDGIEGMQVEVLIDGVPTGNIHTLAAAPISRVTPPLADGAHVVGVRYVDQVDGRVGSLHQIAFTIAP